MDNQDRKDIIRPEEILNAAFDYHISKIFTTIIGTIINASNENGKINVRPSIKFINVAGDLLELPSIVNVPLQLPASQRGGFTFPVASGDNVILLFSQRAIDNWKHGSSTDANASDFRKFSIKDCVAIPCVNPFTQNMNNQKKHIWSHNEMDVLVFHNSRTQRETEIRLLADGGIIINTNQDIEVNCRNSTVNVEKHVEVNTNTAQVNVEDNVEVNTDTAVINVETKAEITCPLSIWEGDIEMKGRLDVDGEVLSNGIQLDAHTHNGVVTGYSNTSQPY